MSIKTCLQCAPVYGVALVLSACVYASAIAVKPQTSVPLLSPDYAPPPHVLSYATPGYVWTGEEIVQWDGQRGFVFTPRGSMREMRANPHAAIRVQWPYPHLLMIGQRRVLVAYIEQRRRVCFDIYDVGTDSWERLLAVPEARFNRKEEPGEREVDWFYIPGGVRCDAGALFFVACSNRVPMRGFRIGRDGTLTETTANGAPDYGSPGDMVVCRMRNKILLWGAIHPGNAGALYDIETDTWTALPSDPFTTGWRYGFGWSFTGSEVIVFGGGWGSAFFSPLGGGATFSFETARWAPLASPGPSEGGVDLCMCFAGAEAFVWGGRRQVLWVSEERGFEWKAGGQALNLKSGTWREIPGNTAVPCGSSARCAWTGSEILVWTVDVAQGTAPIAWALNCETGRWRRIAPQGPDAEDVEEYDMVEHDTRGVGVTSRNRRWRTWQE